MKKYLLKKGFIVQKLGKKTVVFDSENSSLYTFNDTAAYIFKLISQGATYGEIVDKFIKKYKIARLSAVKDINEFTEVLLYKKIIYSSKK